MATPERELIRDWLRMEMSRRGLSQRMLAARSGVNHSTISRLMSGDRAPTWSTVERLAHALGTPIPARNAVGPSARLDLRIRRALLDLGVPSAEVDEMMLLYRRRNLPTTRAG